MKNQIFFVLVVLILASASPSYAAVDILWDTSHGCFSNDYKPSLYGGYYQQLMLLLEGNGMNLDTTSAGFSESTLSGYEIAVIAAPCAASSTYTLTEIATLQSFVFSGGGLLILADASGVTSRYAPVVEGFGASLGDLLFNPVSVSDFTPNSIFDNVGGLSMYYAAAIDTGSAFTSLARTAAGDTIAAGRIYGQGRVIILGDSTLWTYNAYDNPPYLTIPDNSQFALNVFTCLADSSWTPVPEPVTCLILAMGVALTLRKRR